MVIDSPQKTSAASPTIHELATSPAKIAPSARITSGIIIDLGASWTWLIVFLSARGRPWKVMKINRHE